MTDLKIMRASFSKSSDAKKSTRCKAPKKNVKSYLVQGVIVIANLSKLTFTHTFRASM